MERIKKCVRQWLIESTRSEFEEVILEAKLTQRQEHIIRNRILDSKMNFQIAMDNNVSDKTIERDLQLAYMAILRVLQKRNHVFNIA